VFVHKVSLSESISWWSLGGQNVDAPVTLEPYLGGAGLNPVLPPRQSVPLFWWWPYPSATLSIPLCSVLVAGVWYVSSFFGLFVYLSFMLLTFVDFSCCNRRLLFVVNLYFL